MNLTPKKVTRGELYDAVWNKPLNALAKEWNTSYAQIVRACVELNVPRPDSYHWTLISRGLNFERYPLPNADKSNPTDFEFSITRRSPQNSKTLPALTPAPPPAPPAAESKIETAAKGSEQPATPRH